MNKKNVITLIVLICLTFTFLTEISIAEEISTVSGKFSKQGSFYYVDLNNDKDKIQEDFYSMQEQFNYKLPSNFISKMEQEDGSTGLHASMNKALKDEYFQKADDLLGETFNFHAINGINFWSSLNQTHSDIRIWLVKILIPKEDTAKYFKITNDATLHMSYGYYTVANQNI